LRIAQRLHTNWLVTRKSVHDHFLMPTQVNCLHEIFFDAAIEDAQRLDAFYAEHKKPIGPLHGLPISLKDQFHVKGVETHMGYVGWLGTFQGKKGTGLEKVFESEMVKELRKLGAILYVKTSVPHTLMTGETVNNIIDYTWNPRNRNLSSGGSSGGEGALISLKGSPLGFGTDIGGSIRIPAAFNGQYGIKPSSGRMPYEGMANSMDGQNTILSVAGPLSSSLGGLRLALKSILSREPWLHDPLVVEMAWRPEQEQVPSQLVFGVIKNDGIVTPHPPVQRAIEESIKAVEAAGHKVIEWQPPSHEEGLQVSMQAWVYDGGEDVHSMFALSGEPIAKQVSASYGTSPRPQSTASEIAATNRAKRAYQKEYLEYWNSTAELTGTGRPVDGILMPVAPFAAARRERYKYYGYSLIINVIDYTSVVVPVTNVDKSIDVVNKDFKPLNDLDGDVASDCKCISNLEIQVLTGGKTIPRSTMARTWQSRSSDVGFKRRGHSRWRKLSRKPCRAQSRYISARVVCICVCV
jgi:amidase